MNFASKIAVEAVSREGAAANAMAINVTASPNTAAIRFANRNPAPKTGGKQAERLQILLEEEVIIIGKCSFQIGIAFAAVVPPPGLARYRQRQVWRQIAELRPSDSPAIRKAEYRVARQRDAQFGARQYIHIGEVLRQGRNTQEIPLIVLRQHRN